MKDQDSVELSTAFKEALASLPRRVEPSADLEDRLVHALRLRGLIHPVVPLFKQRPIGVAALSLAASLVIFAAGVSFGHWLGASPSPQGQPADQLSAWEMAATVQRTGSQHAAALGNLAARLATAQPEEVELAKEVAMASLRAALQQVALLDPSDPTPARVLAELDAGEWDNAIPVRTGNEPWLVWF
jgi:hypothetical protein